MKIIKKLQLKIADIDAPYSLKDVWLSHEIPNKTKYHGRILRLKEYPSKGEVVHLFSTKKYRLYYKTVKAERRDHLIYNLSCINGLVYTGEV